MFQPSKLSNQTLLQILHANLKGLLEEGALYFQDGVLKVKSTPLSEGERTLVEEARACREELALRRGSDDDYTYDVIDGVVQGLSQEG